MDEVLEMHGCRRLQFSTVLVACIVSWSTMGSSAVVGIVASEGPSKNSSAIVVSHRRAIFRRCSSSKSSTYGKYACGIDDSAPATSDPTLRPKSLIHSWKGPDGGRPARDARGNRGNPQRFISLCYHDVTDHPADLALDAYGVTTSRLVEHFEWFSEQGYVPVRLADVLAAFRGEHKLPWKAVLLVFDDGRRSFFTRVFPLLKLYQYPAVVAIVDSWIGHDTRHLPADAQKTEGAEQVPAVDLLTWEMVEGLQDSGLVEVASHTHALHRGVLANSEGNTQPAAVTAAYDPRSGTYETEAEMRLRVSMDLRRSSDTIYEHTGRRPEMIVWPYGEHARWAAEEAAALGMHVSAVLEGGHATTDDPGIIKRILVLNNPTAQHLADDFWRIESTYPERAVRVRLAEIDDDDPEIRERRLGDLIERIKDIGVSSVHLEVYERDGTGRVSQVYFPTDALPTRRDLANRVSWQLKTRVGVEVFVSLPYAVSGFSQGNQDTVRALYSDLARHVPFSGVLFEGLPRAGTQPRSCSAWLDELFRRVRHYRPGARLALRDGFSTNFECPKKLLRNPHDRLVLVVRPEQVRPNLVGLAVRRCHGTSQLMLELPTVALARPGALGLVSDWVRLLQRSGVRHISYNASGLLDEGAAELRSLTQRISSRALIPTEFVQ